MNNKVINRRDFLKTAGAGMAAFAFSNCQRDQKQNMTSSFQKPNSTPSPHDAFYYYARNGSVEAVRSGK